MRINNNIPPISVGNSDGARRAEQTNAEKNTKADQIQLSSVARSAADAHADKLASLRLRVANASYRPGADEVAASMIDEMFS